MRNLIVIVSSTLVWIGTVLRMWDAIAEADKVGEFAPRNPVDEFRRLLMFFTLLGRREQAATSDRYVYYLRTAQGWFFLAVGTFGGLILAIASVVS